MILGIASLAVSVIGGIMKHRAKEKAADRRKRIAQANLKAKLITTNADNAYKASASSLHSFLRAEKNRRIMKAAGDKKNALNDNITRMMSGFASQSIKERTKAAEALGAINASAAAAGIGGSSIDAINNTFLRKKDISLAKTRNKKERKVRDMQRASVNLITNATAKTDMGLSFANLSAPVKAHRYIAEPNDALAAVGIVSDVLSGLSGMGAFA